MTAIVHGVFQGAVVIEDGHGVGTVPLEDLHNAAVRADMNHSETARVNGRLWHRDVLNAAVSAIADGAVIELDSCWACVDSPAVTTDLRDRPVCLSHAPDDDARESA